MVFFQKQFQKGDFVINVQQKDYDQNPRKVVRNSGTTALDISRVNITLISETRVISSIFYTRQYYSLQTSCGEKPIYSPQICGE
jgi:hypothetical protein